MHEQTNQSTENTQSNKPTAIQTADSNSSTPINIKSSKPPAHIKDLIFFSTTASKQPSLSTSIAPSPPSTSTNIVPLQQQLTTTTTTNIIMEPAAECSSHLSA